jgi:hypothetical protein
LYQVKDEWQNAIQKKKEIHMNKQPCKQRQGKVILLLVLAHSFAFFPTQNARSATHSPDSSNGNLKKVFEYIQQSEYDIRWQDIGTEGAYQSPNRANHYRVTYLNDGVVLTPRDPKNYEFDYTLTMRLDWFGKSLDQHLEPGQAQWAVDRRTALAVGNGITFQYHNREEGMQQNFLIADKPAGPEPLTLAMKVEMEGLRMAVSPDSDYVSFYTSDAANVELLRYHSLKVWDADDNALPASFVSLTKVHNRRLIDTGYVFMIEHDVNYLERQL